MPAQCTLGRQRPSVFLWTLGNLDARAPAAGHCRHPVSTVPMAEEDRPERKGERNKEMKRHTMNRALSLFVTLSMIVSMLCVSVSAAYTYGTSVAQGLNQTAQLMTLGTTTAHPSVFVRETVPTGTPASYEGSYYWLNSIGEVYDVNEDAALQIRFSAGMNQYSDDNWKNNGARYAYVYNAQTGELVANWLDDGTEAGGVNTSGVYQMSFGLYNGSATPANQYGIVYTVPHEALEPSSVYWLVVGSATCGNNNQKMLYYPVVYEFTTSDSAGEGSPIEVSNGLQQHAITMTTVKGASDETSAAAFNRYAGGTTGSGSTATYTPGEAITASYAGQEIAIKQTAQLDGTTFTVNAVTQSGTILPLHSFAAAGGNMQNFGDCRFTMPNEDIAIYAVFGYANTVKLVDESGQVIPDAVVTITDDATGCVFGQESDGSYIIPEGNYSITVTAEGYKTYQGTLDTASAKDHTITMTAGSDETAYAASVTSSGATQMYETLAEAFTAASSASGSTVTLLSDANENISATGTIVVDLNGFAINGTLTSENSASVTIRDGSKDDSGAINGGSGYALYVNRSTIIVESGAFTSEAGSVVCTAGGRAVLTIHGGKFTAPEGTACLSIPRGNASISGGTFSSDSGLSTYLAKGCVIQANALGGFDVVIPTYALRLNVTPADAKVVVKNADGKELTPEADGSYVVQAGTYSYTISAPGYETTEGQITVTDADVTEAITLTKATASVTEADGTVTKYESLHEALTAAMTKTGAIVTLLSDTTENVTAYGTITVDLNGHVLNGTLKFASRGTSVVKDSSADGTGTVNGGASYALSANSGINLTVESGTFTSEGTYALDARGGSTVLTINGGAFTTAQAGSVLNIAGGKASVNGGTFTASEGAQYLIANTATLQITGGTFSQEAICATEGCIPEDYEVVDNGDGTFSVRCLYQASVTDAEGMVTKYATLAEALEAVQSGDTLTLLSDVTGDTSTYAMITVAEGQSLTLDLNGKALTSTAASGYVLFSRGNLVIKDSLGSGSISGGGYCVYSSGESAVLTIEGGTLTSSTSSVVYGNGGSISISGGTFTANVNSYPITFSPYGNPMSVEITGGSYSRKDICSSGDYLVLGYKVVEESNGYFTVVKDVSNMASVTSGDKTTLYESLAQAVAAAADGDTITLLNDVQETVTISKGVTLDLNGCTLTGTLSLGNGCNVTTLDGSKDGSGAINGGSGYALSVTSRANVTVTGGTFVSDGTNPVYTQGVNTYLTIKGGLFTAPEGTSCLYGSGNVTAYGGTFSSQNGLEPVLARGCEIADNGDGTCTVVVRYAAAIGDDMYATVQDAIDAAQPGDVVSLLADTSDTIVVARDDEIVLDLNGKTLTGVTGANYSFTNDGVLTIRDSLGGGVLTMGSTGNYAVFNNGGSITVESGSIVGNNYGMYTSGGSIVVKGGSVSGGSYGISGNSNCSITVEAGSVSGSSNGINNYNGTLTISGGSVTSAKGAAVSNSSILRVTGGTITGYTDAVYNAGSSAAAPASATISGGTFTSGVNNYPINNYNASYGTVTVSGGTFSKQALCSTSGYLAPGYKVEAAQSPEGYFTVVKDTANVASINTNGTEVLYETLQAAMDAAADGDVIVLINDTQESVTNAKEITLDLNGSVITGTVTNTGVLTIQDSSEQGGGSVTASEASAVSNTDGGRLTILSGSFTAVGAGTVSTSGADSRTTIQGGTFTADDGMSCLTISQGAVELLGGTFSSRENLEDNLSVGCEIVDNGDGTYTVIIRYVAAIGDVMYETVQAAIDDAAKGDVIQLLQNTTEAITVAEDDVIVLDLNGKVFTGQAPGAYSYPVTNNGGLTIRDTVGGGQILVTANAYPILNEGTLSLESGAITGTFAGAYGISNSGTVTVTGGSISANGYGISNKSAAIINIDGGAVTGGNAAVYQNAGSLTVTGGTLTGGQNTLYCYGGTVTVTGGTFVCGASGSYPIYASGSMTVAVSGGLFCQKEISNAESYLAEGYIVTAAEEPEGYFTVVEGSSDVAAIGDVMYETVQAAIDDAAKGDVIQLLQNVTEAVTVAEDDEIVLDLNGKILASDSSTAPITNNGVLTVRDTVGGGAINGQKYGIFNKYTGTVTVESGSISGKENTAVYQGPGGYITINGGTLTGGYYAVKSSSNGQITINGGNLTGGWDTVSSFVTPVVVTGGTFVCGTSNRYPIYAFGPATISGGLFCQEEISNAETYLAEGYIVTAAEEPAGYFTVVKEGGEPQPEIYTLTFDITPDTAVVVVKDSQGEEMSSDADGIYHLTPDTYTYTVSAEGYETVEDTVTIVDQNVTETVALVEEKPAIFYLSFDVTPDTAVVVVKNSQDEEVASDADGVYHLTPDTYTYTVSAEGYSTKTGVYTITSGGEYTETVILTKEEEPVPDTYSLTFILNPDTAVVVVKDSQGNEVASDADGIYHLSPDTYTYTVSAEGYDTQESTVTIADQDVALTVTLTKTEDDDDDDDRPSGGGGSGSSSTSTTVTTNPDGSVTTTVTNNRTGTVTATTRYEDGAVKEVVTQSSGTVTTTYTSADRVTVVTVDEPGKDVTATVTLPSDMKQAVVTIPGEVTSGTVAVDAETGDVIKLCVPTEDGLAVLVSGSVQLVLADQGKTFTDTRNHWGKPYIDFVTAHGMFGGTSDTTFSPDASMTRGMIAQVLYAFDGASATGGSVFADVADGAWYADAVNWAAAQGIVGGYGDGTFGPDNNITREQMVIILYNYAKLNGYDVSASADLTVFSDSSALSDYSAQAMSWAVGSGLISGKGDNTLAPQATATRAEVATILMRFCESVVK